MYSFNISIYSIIILQTTLHYLEIFTLNGKDKRQMRSENSEKSKRGFGMVTFSVSAISKLYFSLQISLLNISKYCRNLQRVLLSENSDSTKTRFMQTSIRSFFYIHNGRTIIHSLF